MHADLSFSYLRFAEAASFNKKELRRSCTAWLTAYAPMAYCMTHELYWNVLECQAYHAGVTTVEILDHSSLHPSITHPKTDMSLPGFETRLAGGHSTKELSIQLTALQL